MTSSKKNTEIDFSLDKLFELRYSLTTVQQNILDNMWEHYLSSDKNYPFRSLPKLTGKQPASDALKGLVGLFISEEYDLDHRVLKLNILGALLSSKGSALAALIIRLLDFIREQYAEDFHLNNLTSEFLQKHLELTEVEVITLFRLMNLYGLYSLAFSRAGYSSSKDWSINISDEIVEFNTFKDSKNYLSTRLEEFYIQQRTRTHNIAVEGLNKAHDETTDIMKLPFVSTKRINIIQSSSNPSFDCARLVNLCKELNDCAYRDNTNAVAMLTRAILDHIPPIFGFKSFAEVASNHGGGGKSFKAASERLEKQMRSVADKFLHLQIRNKEVVPDMHEVNFSQELESVLSEVCRLLK